MPASAGFTLGRKLPQGTGTLARFIGTPNRRPGAGFWKEA